MARISDLLGSSDLPYPGWNGGSAGGSSSGNYQPPAQQGFFNQYFAPTDLPYPLPPFVTTTGAILNPSPPTAGGATAVPGVTPPPATPSAAPSQPGTSATPAATPPPGTPSQPAAASQPIAPVTVIVQACPTPTSGNASSSDNGQGTSSTSGSTSVKSTMPVGNCPTPPNEQIVTAFATNPRLRARSARGQELLIEEMTGENVALRMLSKDSAPVAFVVPDGCNAVDFTFGAIELNPGHGRPGDLGEVITVGALKVDGLDPSQQLTPGDQLSVVVPWRYGSWVELAADRLRLPILARFYQIESA